MFAGILIYTVFPEEESSGAPLYQWFFFVSPILGKEKMCRRGWAQLLRFPTETEKKNGEKGKGDTERGERRGEERREKERRKRGEVVGKERERGEEL